MPSRSTTFALWTLASSTRPCVSTSRWRLRAFDLLGAVVSALFSAHPGRLDRLAIDYAGTRLGVPLQAHPAPARAGLSASSPTSRPNARERK